jgi:cobalt/nickel transport system permease protein
MSIIDTSANLNRWRRKSLAEKALLAFGMLLIAIVVPSWVGAILVAALMTVATLVGARVAPSIWSKVVTAPLGFLAAGLLSIVFQFHQGHLALAPHGLELAGRVAARAGAGVSCLLFLALTTPVTDLVAGLRRIGVPPEIAEVTLLMYRFLFLLTGTATAMNIAQSARLGHSSYRRWMKSLGMLIANLMPRALARARSLEVGLAARGWRGELRVLSPVRRVSVSSLGLIALLELIVLVIGLKTS